MTAAPLSMVAMRMSSARGRDTGGRPHLSSSLVKLSARRVQGSPQRRRGAPTSYNMLSYQVNRTINYDSYDCKISIEAHGGPNPKPGL